MLKTSATGAIPEKKVQTKQHHGFRLNANDKYYASLFLGPSLLILGLFVFYPMLKTLYISMFLTNTFGKTTIYVGLDNYVKLISNPDVSRRDSYAPFTIEGKSMNCTMVIYTDKPYTEGTLSQYIKVGLVPLNEQFIPIQQNGITTIYTPEQASDFQERTGKNTNYVIDPEEILAENFSYLMVSKADLPNPQLVEDLGKALQN